MWNNSFHKGRKHTQQYIWLWLLYLLVGVSFLKNASYGEQRLSSVFATLYSLRGTLCGKEIAGTDQKLPTSLWFDSIFRVDKFLLAVHSQWIFDGWPDYCTVSSHKDNCDIFSALPWAKSLSCEDSVGDCCRYCCENKCLKLLLFTAQCWIFPSCRTFPNPVKRKLKWYWIRVPGHLNPVPCNLVCLDFLENLKRERLVWLT